MRWRAAANGPTRLKGMPRGVMIAFAVVVFLPVVAWLASPPATSHLSAMSNIIGMMLGTVLATIVFMLWAAQNARQVALNNILAEFSERDRRLCEAAGSDDIEPWLTQMRRELQHVETIAAIAALRPGERRICQWDKREAEKAIQKARALQRASRDYRKLQERAEALQAEHEEIIRAASSRVDKVPTASTPDQRLSEQAMQLEDVLSAELRPLETAYVLTASVLSLTATTAAYSREAILWPIPPGLLSAAIVASIAVLYIGFVRRTMTEAGMAAARRLRRLTAPAMQDADELLSDRFVARATTPHDPAETRLQEALGALPPVELPLRHRLLGQYHLAVAWQALPQHHHELPDMADFGCSTLAAPVAAERIVHELQLARDHLERAAQARQDDPLALLALDAVHDAMAAVRGEDAAPYDGRGTAEAALARSGSDGLDWVDQLREHRWLWPRDPGRLTELVADLDRDEPRTCKQSEADLRRPSR